VLVGLVGAVGAATVGIAERAGAAGEEPAPALEATHVPPLLTASGEDVRLAYDLNCATDDDPSGCVGSGTVYLRPGDAGAFVPYPLRFDASAQSGRYSLDVPAAIAHDTAGFSYYAVFDGPGGGSVTVPAAGADAPERSVPLENVSSGGLLSRGESKRGTLRVHAATTVALGSHRFHGTRAASERVVSASWGDGPDTVGLEGGPQSQPIGASSFDVAPNGDVVLLDEAHKRLLTWRRSKVVDSHGADVNGTIADLALAGDGSAYVLESTPDADDEGPSLRHVDSRGHELESWAVADRRASEIRMGNGGGPEVLEYPSSEWIDVGAAGHPLSGRSQLAHGHVGRQSRDGSDVVVLRTGDELRIALTHGRAQKAWRITSRTPLAEVQLAEPFRDGVLAVVRTYTDVDAEFVVLVLGRAGIVSRFSVPGSDWADSAPLSRFRLAGNSLYQLGSTPAGVFVDRYDLGG
jgi:hypothetical protein